MKSDREMTAPITIQTRNLTKYYGKNRGIENLNLEVRKGEIFGFLGPNGAGKTTTIRLLLDLIRKTSGEATIFGYDTQKDSQKIREHVAYIPGELGFYKDWTGRRTLQYLFKLYNHAVKWAVVEELAQVFKLNLDKKVRELSKGNKQKIGAISALAPDVDLLILDEPTSGLDPLVKNEFYKALSQKHAKSGCTIFLSSHVLQEVEKVAHRVSIIRQGFLVEVADLSQLKRLALKHVEVSLASPADSKALKEKLTKQLTKTLTLEGSHASFLAKREDLSSLLSLLQELGFRDLNISDSTLEDIFLEYYNAKANGKAFDYKKAPTSAPNSRKAKRMWLK
jgi:ABC-2 type transport system ATP-binding protein